MAKRSERKTFCLYHVLLVVVAVPWEVHSVLWLGPAQYFICFIAHLCHSLCVHFWEPPQWTAPNFFYWPASAMRPPSTCINLLLLMRIASWPSFGRACSSICEQKRFGSFPLYWREFFSFLFLTSPPPPLWLISLRGIFCIAAVRLGEGISRDLIIFN